MHVMKASRTTLAIEDDAMAAAREFATRRGVSLGQAVTELIRRGSSRRLTTQVVDGLHLPVLPENSPVVTLARILELEDE
jgi:hypothetical protein